MAAKRTTKRAPARRAPARRAPEREREPRDDRGQDRGGDRDGRSQYGRGRGGSRGSSDLTRMGGLWKKKTKRGDPMLSGLVNVGEFLDYIEKSRLRPEDRAPVLVLVNSYKKEDRHPDFNFFGVDPASRQRRGNGNGGGRGGNYNRGGNDRRDDRGNGGRQYERQDDGFGGEDNSL